MTNLSDLLKRYLPEKKAMKLEQELLRWLFAGQSIRWKGKSFQQWEAKVKELKEVIKIMDMSTPRKESMGQ